MKGASFIIDKITNSIEDAGTGKSFNTEVVLLGKGDLKGILKKNGWRFNWRKEFKEKNRRLFKLVLQGSDIIQGLISIEVVENYVEMHLIETAPQNYGASKKYSGVPANLVAFACKMSFDNGFDGFVAFTAKTQLIDHYINTLGAELLFRNRMSISAGSAKKIVNSYYKNYIID